MIDFQSKYNNGITYYGIGSYWTGIAKPKQVVTIASNFDFYGQIGMFQTWNAKGGTTPTGGKGKYRTLLGVGV
jgi:hypothetical protein